MDLKKESELFAQITPKNLRGSAVGSIHAILIVGSLYLTDPARVTINAYRVLMTRGRDGVCLYIPRSDDPRFDATANLLIAGGASLLTEGVPDCLTNQT